MESFRLEDTIQNHWAQMWHYLMSPRGIINVLMWLYGHSRDMVEWFPQEQNSFGMCLCPILQDW